MSQYISNLAVNVIIKTEKRLNMLYICPICGYDRLEEPPYIDGYIPSHDICDCCGSEFGLDDCTQEQIEKNRKKWIDMGYPWFSLESKPINWDPNEQLKNIQ